MKHLMRGLARVVVGVVLGYAAYYILVLASVLLKAARLHYFDKEALLFGSLAPIGAFGGYLLGDWYGYPLWVHLRNLAAYGLMVCGGVWALRWRVGRFLRR